MLVLAAASGGAYPTAWDVLAIGMAGLTIAALLAGAQTGRRAATGVVLLAATTLLSAASYAWSVDRPATAAEVQRWLALTVAFAAFTLVARAWGARAVMRGCAAAATLVAVYALAMRLLPEWTGGAGHRINRLYEPLGYWNALGELAALGLILSAGLAGHGRRSRTLAAGAAVPLTAALYLTFSRGALLALLVGMLILIALERDRLAAALRIAILVVPGAAAVAIVHSLPALTEAFPPRSAQVRDGAIATVLLCALAGAAMAVAWRGGDPAVRLLGDVRKRRRVAIALIVVGVAVAVIGVASIGGVSGVIRLVGTGGESAPHFPHGDLNLRLLSLSPNGRSEIWRVAWRDFTAHPLLGSGDGSFGQRWLEQRPEVMPAVAAHSLYLETAAELGVAGLILLLGFFANAMLAVVRARESPLTPALAGALGAAAVQQALDWTWDATAVTVVVLACVAALASSADRRLPAVRLGPAWFGGAAALVGIVAAVALAGNVAVGRAYDALAGQQFALARSRASLAADLAPWSSAPWRIAAYADGKLGHQAQARADAHRGIDVSPNDWWFRFKLACLARGPGRQRNLDAVHRLNPLAPELHRFPVRCGEPL